MMGLFWVSLKQEQMKRIKQSIFTPLHKKIPNFISRLPFKVAATRHKSEAIFQLF